jgi:hypothetical protein
MKKKFLFLFLIFIPFVSAYQDSYITLSGQGSGLCIGLDNKTNSVCDNQVITVEGTADHTLYILPETVINSGSNMTAHMSYALLTPLNLIFVFGFFGLVAGLMVLSTVLLMSFLGMFKNYFGG